MNVRVITASAGSGKTTRLSRELDDAIARGEVRPEGVIATTFTRQAAAELVERARTRLLESRRGHEAHKLLAARIGTVNAVCGSLVTDYAFELGLSPSIRVLDEAAAELELKRALAAVVTAETASALERFRYRFDQGFEWRHEVRKLVEAARANGLDAEALRACGARSSEALDACLGACEPDGGAVDRALAAAMREAIAAIDTETDSYKGTRDYVELLDQLVAKLDNGQLRWGDWAKLAKETPCKPSRPHAAPVHEAAARHAAHPGLRAEMHELIRLLFDVASAGLTAYQDHKRERGVIDYGDQEALALDLLARDDVRADLDGQIDLVLVDEFQDTSPIQLAIFLELATLAASSVWVGDPKQAIFGFRGTDPKLMDAAIEALTSPEADPDLVAAAAKALEERGTIESLDTSYRSRPQLVDITSDVFARAFAHQGIPEERTRLSPASRSEPDGLGPVVEHWPLVVEGRVNKDKLAAAAAAGVRDLLGERDPRVRDRDGGARAATAADVAVLCRTNAQCQTVADALAALGVRAIVPRMGLFGTAEGQLAIAGLRLWIDPRDALAAAEIARIVSFPTDGDGFTSRALGAPGEAFADDPTVTAILGARASRPDLGPAHALDAVVDAAGARDLAAGWGDAPQRLANLDALRAHARAYEEEAAAGRDAASIAGLLRHFADMVDTSGWYAARTDRQALLGGEEAVTVSTWHRAKGLEWPITVLFGLETLRPPMAHGIHVLGDRDDFDLADPLGGRWIRFWPNPYTNANQKGAVRDAYEDSDAFAVLRDRADREALRVLYVGWTRARDRLVLAAQPRKLLGGLLGRLVDVDPTLIAEPTAPQVTWAGRALDIGFHPAAPAEPVATAPEPGTVIAPRGSRAHEPAQLYPSAMEPVACELGSPVELGPHLPVRGTPDMELVGRAVHELFACDDPGADDGARRDTAARLLRGYGVADHVAPEDAARAAARLWTWLARHQPGARARREWPIAEALATGTTVTGTADLVLESEAGVTIVDHKTFPGTLEAALERIPGYSGQLRAYARALAAATGKPILGTWIHLPLVGAAVPVHLPDA